MNVVTARCYERPAKVDALLIRPDGYVAWVAGPNETDQDSERSLTMTLNKWFGEANEVCEQNRPSAAA